MSFSDWMSASDTFKEPSRIESKFDDWEWDQMMELRVGWDMKGVDKDCRECFLFLANI